MSTYSGPQEEYLPLGCNFNYTPNLTKFVDPNIIVAPDYNDMTRTRFIQTGINSSSDNAFNNPPSINIFNPIGNVATFNSINSSDYTVSFWVKINRFPKKEFDHWSQYLQENEHLNIRSKKTKLIELNYGLTNTGYFNSYSVGKLEFGAMAPHYFYDSAVEFKYVFEPISFTATITSNKVIGGGTSDKGRVFSIYSDYLYSLNTWYFITFNVYAGVNLLDTTEPFSLTMYVNNVNVEVATCNGNPVVGKPRRDLLTGVYRQPARTTGRVAGGPGFLGPAGDQAWVIDSGVMHGYTISRIFYNPLKLDNLNLLKFSPTFSSYYHMERMNSGIDFGKIYIYTSYDNTLYSKTSQLYV